MSLTYGIHAVTAQRDHNITNKQVNDAWLFGELVKGKKKCWRLIGEEVTLILNKTGDFIITMYPNKGADREIAESVKERRRDGKSNVPPQYKITELLRKMTS